MAPKGATKKDDAKDKEKEKSAPHTDKLRYVAYNRVRSVKEMRSIFHNIVSKPDGNKTNLLEQPQLYPELKSD